MPWELDNDRPIYLQLMERIQQDIVSGVYHAGDKLPSVRDLAIDAASIPIRCKKHCPNWSGADFCTPGGPAGDLLRRMKRCYRN